MALLLYKIDTMNKNPNTIFSIGLCFMLIINFIHAAVIPTSATYNPGSAQHVEVTAPNPANTPQSYVMNNNQNVYNTTANGTFYTSYHRYKFLHPTIDNADITSVQINFSGAYSPAVGTSAGTLRLITPQYACNQNDWVSPYAPAVANCIGNNSYVLNNYLFANGAGVVNCQYVINSGTPISLSTFLANSNTDDFTIGMFGLGGYVNITTPISVKITFNTYPIGNNAITQNSSILCSGSTLISGTAPTGGYSAYQYQWQRYNTGTGQWDNITTGGTGVNYQTPQLTQTTQYRRIVISSPQPQDVSNVITVVVNPPSPPTNITIVPQNTSQLAITWNASPAATSYEIKDCATGVSTPVSAPAGNPATVTYVMTGLAPATTYNYSIKALCPAGASPGTICYAGTTMGVPDAPNAYIQVVSTNALKVIWVNYSPGNVTGFKVHNCANGAVIATVGPSVLSFVVNNLTPATTYDYYVTAFNAAGSSMPSNCVTAATFGIPAAPAGVAIQPQSTTALNISWNASTTGATSYEIYDCPVAPATPVLIGTVNAPQTTYAISGLNASTAYQYNVVAVNNAGSSPPSSCASGVTGSPITNNDICCDQTSICSALVTPLTGAMPVGGIGGIYNYTWETDGGTGTWAVIPNANSAGYAPPGAVLQTTKYRRTATSGPTNLISNVSAPVTINITPPAIPTNVVATPQSQTNIMLTWNASPGATSYNIYSCPPAPGIPVFVTNVTGTSYNSTGLTANTLYSYNIAAVCGANISNIGICNSATTLPPPLTNPNICCNQTNIGFMPTIQKAGAVPTGGYGPGTVTFQWENCTNLILQPGVQNWFPVSGATSWHYTPPPLSQTTLFRRVAYSNDLSVTSNIVQVTVNLPPAPTNLLITSQSAHSLLLTWNASTNATGYQVYNCSTNALIATVGAQANSYLATGLNPNSTYSYYVVAVSGPLSSAASTCANGTTTGQPPSQQISTFAGSGSMGNSGDGGLATLAAINPNNCITGAPNGDIYISDRSNSVIRKIDASGIITKVAGTALSSGYLGDGGPATQARINLPWGMVVDAAGNLYFTDRNNNCIRKVDAATQVISTIAGNGVAGYSGDNGPASAAILKGPGPMAIDLMGNIYFFDTGNRVIRKIDASGIITTIAGNGTNGYNNGTIAALSSPLANVYALAVNSSDLFMSDYSNHTVRALNFQSGLLYPYAGNGTAGSSNGGIAYNGQLNTPVGICFDDNNDLLIADYGNNIIRKVTTATGQLSTYAGTGAYGFSGDGGQPLNATFDHNSAMFFNTDGLYFFDDYNGRLRVIYSYCYANAGPATAYNQQGCCGGAFPVKIGSQALTGLNYSWNQSGANLIDCNTCAMPNAVSSNINQATTYMVTVTGNYCTTKQDAVSVHTNVNTGGSCCRIGQFASADETAAGTGKTALPEDNRLFYVFPNPSNGHVTIKLYDEAEYLRIVDLLGNTIYVKTGITEAELNLDLSEYPAGVYFVMAKIGKNLEKKKLVIE